jgi:hypothetical protein
MMTGWEYLEVVVAHALTKVEKKGIRGSQEYDPSAVRLSELAW